jgi:hypothetical protein
MAIKYSNIHSKMYQKIDHIIPAGNPEASLKKTWFAPRDEVCP